MDDTKAEMFSHENRRKQRVDTFHSMLYEMKNDGSYTDVIIICEEKEFPVHKLILVATCSFFKDLFKSQFKESQTNRVEMPTITSSVMEIITDFMYFKNPSDIQNETLENAIETFKASHLLGYESLSNECWHKIKDELSIENYKMIWDLCSLYQLDKYIKDIAKFLLDNLEILLTDDYFLDLSTDQILTLLEVARENEILIDDVMAKRLLEWVKKDVSKKQFILSDIFNRVNMNNLSRDYLNYLSTEEPMIYNDKAVLLNIVACFTLPKLDKEIPRLEIKDVGACSSKENVTAYFFGFKKNSKGKGFIQKLDVKKQIKEKSIPLPFQLMKNNTFVQSDSLLHFVEDDVNHTEWGYCVYHTVTNECVYKCYSTKSEELDWIFSFLDCKGRFCLSNIFNETKNQVKFYSENDRQFFPYFELHSSLEICSSMILNNDLYILATEYDHKPFYVLKLEDDVIKNEDDDPVILLTSGPNLITNFDDKFYLFEFNDMLSRCVTINPLSKECKSTSLEFHLPNADNGWTIFPRNDCILFFSYQKTFEYYPKTHEVIDICDETTHDLRYDCVEDELNQSPGHVYMWVD